MTESGLGKLFLRFKLKGWEKTEVRKRIDTKHVCNERFNINPPEIR